MFLLNSFYRYLMTQKTIFVYLLSSTFIFVFLLFIIVISIVFLLQQIINIDKYYCSTVRGITSVVAMKCRAKFVILFIYFILCKFLPYSQYTWLLYISQTILRVHVAICTKKSTFLYCAPLFWRHNSKIIICFFIFICFLSRYTQLFPFGFQFIRSQWEGMPYVTFWIYLSRGGLTSKTNYSPISHRYRRPLIFFHYL